MQNGNVNTIIMKKMIVIVLMIMVMIILVTIIAIMIMMIKVILAIAVVIMINNPFQPSCFSTGSTTDNYYELYDKFL